MAKTAKKKGLSNKEFVEKYEAGEQPINEMLTKMLNTPNPKAIPKIKKR